MKKNLRKNKKGFTLVEIIVVLLIIGILLAITIPSIMGYVGKARDAAIEAKGRAGYVAAQSLVAADVAAGKELKTATDENATVTANKVFKDLGETDASKATIQSAGCTYANNNIVKCAFITSESDSKIVLFDTTDKEEPTKIITSKELDANLKMVTITKPEQ